MKGYRLIYLFAMISILISQIFTTMSPLILQITIDNILGDEISDKALINSILSLLGDRDFLRDRIWIIGIVIIVFAILRGVFLYFKNTLASKSAENTTKKIRDSLYDHIQRLTYSFHISSDTGELIQKCTSDVETIRKFLAIQLVEVIGSLFMLIFIIIIMLSINIKMTAVSIIVLPITFLFSFVFFKKVKRDFTASDQAEARLTTNLQENLTGVRVVKAFSRQVFEINKFDEKNKDFQKLTFKLVKDLSIYWGLSDFLSMTQVGIVIVFGSYMSYIGDLSLGSLVAFITYINMLIWPVRQLGRTLTDMGKANVSLIRIEEIFSNEIEVLYENKDTFDIKGDIEFKDVSFKYEDGKEVLSEISFKIKSGETLALIGPTGSGKSSLVNLIPRLYEYTSGSILIDGRELNTIDKGFIRKNIALILQEPFLYAKTIKENIKLQDPCLKDIRVYNAAKTASIHNDIESFEEGYETMVGERGVSLSGGQKQRIAIARTIINNSPIIIFDDSLSAVDTDTDISIRKALKNRQNKSTTIIISHRIATVSQADLILVIDKGKIIQKGSHEDLLAKEGLYRRVYNIQNSLDDETL